jgi:GNAT superfamily N-acetyltransferase
MIRSAMTDDAAALAEVHVAALPDDFLPRLGRRYLRRRFYPMVLMSSGVDLFVAERSDEVLAFALFVEDGESLSSALAADWAGLAMYVPFAVLRRPSVVCDIIGQRRREPDLSRDISGVPELYLMASEPGCQSKGLGGNLLEHGLEVLGTRNQGCVVKTSSSRARQFYERHGFELVGVERRATRSLDVLLWPSPTERP